MTISMAQVNHGSHELVFAVALAPQEGALHVLIVVFLMYSQYMCMYCTEK